MNTNNDLYKALEVIAESPLKRWIVTRMLEAFVLLGRLADWWDNHGGKPSGGVRV